MKTKKTHCSRILSILLSLSMIMGIIITPNTVFASYSTQDGYSEERADLSFRYLGTTDTAVNRTSAIPNGDLSDFTWTPNSYIWVGVYVQYMTRISDMFNSEEGLQRLTVNMLYNDQYLEWTRSDAANSFKFLSGEKGENATYPNTKEYDEYYYKSEGTAATALSSLKGTAEWRDNQFYPIKITGYDNEYESNIQVAKQAISYDDSQYDTSSYPDSRMFDGSYMKDDETLVAIFPFKMKDVAAPSDGTNILEGVFSSSTFVINVGTGDNSYNYNEHPAGSSDEKELKYRFNIVNNVINLFPAKYTVTYHAGDDASFSAGNESKNTESVLEGEHPTLKNSDGNEISSLLTPPEGKVFEGWYEGEVCTHGDETKFDTSSTVSADKDVHAHYTDGYKVTFNLNGENAQFADGNSDAKSFTASKGESVIQTSLQDLIGTDPTRNDYTFDGWYTKKEDTFIKKYEEQDIRDNTENSLDLYAKWKPTNAESKQYTLHFDANLPAEGVETQADPQSVKYENGDKLQDLIGGLPVPPKPQGTYEGYDFLGWYKNKSGDGEMMTEDQAINEYVTADETNNATVYASWGYVLGPYDKPQEDAITVHFDNTGGKYSGTEGGTYKNGTIKDKTVKYGGKIANMPDPADMTLEGKGFDGWYTKQNGAGTKVTADTLINGDLDVEPKLTETTGQTLNLYANWSDQITISFDDNGATGDNPESIQIYSGQSLQDAGKTLPDNPTRDNYEFLGWFYEADGDIKQAQNDTVFTEDTQLHAKWRGKINVSFKTKSFVYNDTEQTPLTDDNLEITLLDNGGQKVEPTVTISDLKADSFTAQYKKHEGETIYNSNVPKDANKYDIKLTIKEETIQSLNKEKYMEYTPVTFDNEYDITAKSITLKVSNNYQYLNDTSGITPIELTFNDGTEEPKPNITDIFTSDDIKVTFTDAKNTDTEDAMPNAFGKYDIKVESTNTNYEIETLVDSQADGDADLHLVPLKRTVTFNFGEGKAAIEGAAQAGNTMDYTITFTDPTGTNPTAGETIKATIEDNGDKKILPVSGTDFIPPESYKLVKFVTLGEGEESPSDTSPEFNVDTDISPSADPLVVYAVYELDEVDVTFNDTKTTDTETAIKYTVQAGQAIQDDGAVKKIDGEVQTATDVPTPKKAPANKKFAGWSTDKSFADGSITGNYHESDWTSHDKEFEKSTEITGAIDVYAVYILSDDASLKKPGDDGTGSGALFKKDSSDGDDLPYANEQWEKQPDQKFDPDTEKHYLIVDDDETETVYGEITPSQPGSNVEVKVNGQPVEGGVTGPDENGKVTFTFKPEQTTYDKDHDTNSSTKVEVTVTAPDGTTSETYEFDILQYAKPEIVLEYGNSPVGLINRMAEDVSSPWDKDKIKQATDAFNDSHEINKKFGVGLVPTNGQADLTYVAEAWRSYKDDGGQVINYDLNPYALFAYEGSTFTVPGYTVYNELDREVSGAEANVNFVVKEVTRVGACKYDSSDQIQDLNMQTKLMPGSKNKYDLTNSMVRMDVYPVKYTYQLTLQDGGTEDLSVERPVIIIGRRGDIYLNPTPTINDGDVDYLRVHTQEINSGNSLVAYRCMDFIVNETPTINDGDVDYLRVHTQDVNGTHEQFYSDIN